LLTVAELLVICYNAAVAGCSSDNNQTRSRPSSVEIVVQVLPEAADLPLPDYQTGQSAGMDVCAAIPEAGRITIQPGQRVLVSTGLRIALPPGVEAQIRPRSGLAVKHGVTVVNAPGTIDADYRGTVKIALINLGNEPFVISHGQRIAQMVIAPVVRGEWKVMVQLPESERGAGGFGSTGQ